ncbi:MAG: LexA family protein [Minisyncoccota bacterium]
MEELEDTLSIDEYLIDNKEATFLLEVKGNSMKDDGIIAGDLIIVERGKTPRVNDIVIIEENGEYKMKHFPKSSKKEIHVVAVVTAVVRKYK